VHRNAVRSNLPHKLASIMDVARFRD